MTPMDTEFFGLFPDFGSGGLDVTPDYDSWPEARG
jgi:hypothetical protein